MKIVIVGNGKVGRAITERLAQEMQDVTVIDTNASTLESTDRFDVMGIVGNGATYEVQREAGADKADLLIAVTSSDELNLLCCLLAKKLGARSTIARVRNPEYSGQMKYLRDELGLSMDINPELETAAEIFRVLRCPAASTLRPFAGGRAEAASFTLRRESGVAGMTLAELRSQVAHDLLVCGVQREGRAVIPGGDFKLMEGDKLLVVAAPKAVDDFFRDIHAEHRGLKKVMIAGGSRLAFYLAQRLEKVGASTVIIDRDHKRCTSLARQLAGARIVCGDASDQELLQEEGIAEADAFISLTGLDEQNIMLSIYAAGCGVSKVITKVNNISFPAMMENLGLDTIVSPKATTADQIVAYVRAMQASEGAAMETMYKLMDGALEALDFRVSGGSIIGVPLRELPLRAQTLIACVVRGGKAIIPDGNTTIECGDNVIVITANGKIKDLQDILG